MENYEEIEEGEAEKEEKCIKKIIIDNDYFILITKHNYTLKKKSENYSTIIGFYPNIESCLKRLIKERVNNAMENEISIQDYMNLYITEVVKMREMFKELEKLK